jgi:ribosomal protein S25
MVDHSFVTQNIQHEEQRRPILHGILLHVLKEVLSDTQITVDDLVMRLGLSTEVAAIALGLARAFLVVETRQMEMQEVVNLHDASDVEDEVE